MSIASTELLGLIERLRAEVERLRDEVEQLRRDLDWHREHGWGEPE